MSLVQIVVLWKHKDIFVLNKYILVLFVLNIFLSLRETDKINRESDMYFLNKQIDIQRT